MIYARKGERITCQKGHELFEFLCDVNDGELMDLSSQIKPINRFIMPDIGTPLEECICHCGAKYVFDGAPGIFHFSDGWRE